MRINSIVNLIKKDSVVLDVGSDHAFLAVNLLKKNIAKFIYNIEINQKPLENTIKNLKNSGVILNTKNILNDGLSNLSIQQKINYCTISGMGGIKIIKILKNASCSLNIERFIFIPNNGANSLRLFLKKNNWLIEFEEIICENNKFYELIMVNKKNGLPIQTQEDELFGPYNLLYSNENLTKYIRFIYEKNKKFSKYREDKNYNLVVNYLKKQKLIN